MIDTHAHLMFPEFDDDRAEVVRRSREAGLRAIINVGCGVELTRKAVEMADGEFLYATVGLHPYDAEDLTEELMGGWEKLILEDGGKKIVGIGETGLDYFKAKTSAEDQKKSFKAHLELARRTGVPVVVHNRDADEDCWELLRQFPEVKVVFHCYGSTLEFARRLWEVGYITSFTGIVTYPNAGALREVVKVAPLDRFFVETDCPFLTPQSSRGKRNDPSFVEEVLKCIAEVKGLSFEEVEEMADANSAKFFNLGSPVL